MIKITLGYTVKETKKEPRPLKFLRISAWGSIKRAVVNSTAMS
jgi:hypothetical protein